MGKITPFLWFDNQAAEAMQFYASIFKNSKVGNAASPGEDVPAPGGHIVSGSFQLEGVDFIAFNGGPQFKFNEAISLYVHCESQEEVDYYWDRLSEGGQSQQCGWIKDKFGVWWQIIPSALPRLLRDPDRTKANRVMQAMLQMKKIEVAKLAQAYNG